VQLLRWHGVTSPSPRAAWFGEQGWHRPLLLPGRSPMIPPLTAALRQVRADLADFLEPLALREVCRSLGHRWRERGLDPVPTIHLSPPQVLHGNPACPHLPPLAGRAFTASAYCQGRARLPLAVLQAVLRRLAETLRPLADTTGSWFGHRTWFLDGTG